MIFIIIIHFNSNNTVYAIVYNINLDVCLDDTKTLQCT